MACEIQLLGGRIPCRRCKKSIPGDSIFCNYCGAKQELPKRARKRATGTGTVFKLPGKRAKPWAARHHGMEDEDGQFHRPLIGTYKTKAEAEKALAESMLLPTSENANITLEGLFEAWKKTRAYTELTKSTQDNYGAAMAYAEQILAAKFSDLRTAHFQSVIDAAEKKGKSRSTLEKIKAILTILSKYAYSQDIVHKTYYQGIRLPRHEKKEIPTFTDTEIAKLFKHTKDGISDTILILIYTGMRIQELLTLTKFNVDIEGMLITGGVKTEAGRDRIIPIHPKIQPFVKARYETCENYLLEYDKEIGNKKHGPLKIVRSKYRYEYYCDLYYAALEKQGIRRLTPHKARHTFFTRLSERCDDKKGMAIVGGHTDPNFTEKAYVQPDIDRLRKVINCL